MSKPDKTRVRDAIVEQPPAIDGMASVAEALALMGQAGREMLIVDKRDPEDEFGLITLAQIAAQVQAPRRNASRVNVYEIMDKPALTLKGGMQARYAARLMSRLGQKAAVAEEDGALLGAVGLGDLALALARAGE